MAKVNSSLRRSQLQVTRIADGSRLEVPMIVLAGMQSRPRLVCVAGIHGDEPEGMRALMELADELDPTKLKGELVLIPVANPSAFGAGSRVSPLDGLDLNRIFPGRANGSASERLAHALFEQVLSKADFVFALHSWYPLARCSLMSNMGTPLPGRRAPAWPPRARPGLI